MEYVIEHNRVNGRFRYTCKDYTSPAIFDSVEEAEKYAQSFAAEKVPENWAVVKTGIAEDGK